MGLLLLLLALVLFFRHLPGLVIPPLEQVPADFLVYFQAVQRWRLELSPYDPSRVMTFKYSPGAFGFFVLAFFGAESPGEAWLRFKAFSLITWGLTIYRIWPKRSAWDFLWLALGLLWSWKGLLEALDFGQVEVAAIAPLLLGFALAPTAPAVSVALAALLPFIKLPWILASIGIVFAARPKKWDDWLPAVAVVLALGLALPLILFSGATVYADWLEVLRIQPTTILVTEPANQSLSAVFGRTLGYPELGVVLAGLLVAFQAVRAYQRRRFAVDPEADALTWLSLLCLVSPLSWRWASLWFIQLPLVTARGWKDSQVRTLTGVLVLTWLLTQNPVVRFFGLNHWTDLHSGGWVTLQWMGIFVAAPLLYRRQVM